jgi:[ribosomal protein S5]-alanine N-acetyltransferase
MAKNSPASQLSIRPMEPTDIPHIVNYWTNADPADFVRMGVDVTRVPPAEQLQRQLLTLCDSNPQAVNSFYLIWIASGKPLGYASLKSIVRGERGDMHLHMWDQSGRGRGYGAVFFCLSAIDFYNRFNLQAIVCEPRAANPMPNRMVQRIGFPLQRTYWGRFIGVECILRAEFISHRPGDCSGIPVAP